MNYSHFSKAALMALSMTLTALSPSLAAKHQKKMIDHGSMNHDNMNMGEMKKAPPAKAGDLMVSGAWARQSFGRAVNSAGFMTIKNMGASDDILIGASSPISNRAELHTHIKDGDVMKMRRVKGGISIPKGGSAELKPGGMHVMFLGLKAPLKSGTRFPVTLKFSKAGDVTINITAQKMAMPANMDKMNHGVMDHGNMNHGKMGMGKMEMKK